MLTAIMLMSVCFCCTSGIGAVPADSPAVRPLEYKKYAVLNEGSAYMLADAESGELFEVKPGDEVIVSGMASNGFIRIEQEGKTCFLDKDIVLLDPYTETKFAAVDVTVYSSTRFEDIIGTIKPDEPIVICGEVFGKNCWYVEFEGGTGYVRYDGVEAEDLPHFLKKDADSEGINAPAVVKELDQTMLTYGEAEILSADGEQIAVLDDGEEVVVTGITKDGFYRTEKGYVYAADLYFEEVEKTMYVLSDVALFDEPSEKADAALTLGKDTAVLTKKLFDGFYQVECVGNTGFVPVNCLTAQQPVVQQVIYQDETPQQTGILNNSYYDANVIRLDGNATAEDAAAAYAYYLQVPQVLRNYYERQGYTITITTKPMSSYNGGGSGFYNIGKVNGIVLSTGMPMEVVHEMGHALWDITERTAQLLGNGDDGYIMNELGSLQSLNWETVNNKGYFAKNFKEYCAGAFQCYCLNNNALANGCPQTYSRIQYLLGLLQNAENGGQKIVSWTATSLDDDPYNGWSQEEIEVANRIRASVGEPPIVTNADGSHSYGTASDSQSVAIDTTVPDWNSSSWQAGNGGSAFVWEK